MTILDEGNERKVRKMNKTKMYALVKCLIGNVPKMKNTEFLSCRGACWLKYSDTDNDHYMSIYYDVCMGKAYFLKKDISGGLSETIRIPMEKLNDFGLIV